MRTFEHTVTSEKPFEEAVLAIERTSAEMGFRVLHTHDVAATLLPSSIAEFFPRAGIEGLAAEVESVVLRIIEEAR